MFAVCFNFADLRQIFLLNVWPGKCLEAQCAQTAQTSSCLITPESSEIIHFPSFVYLLIIILIQLSENLSVEFGTKCTMPAWLFLFLNKKTQLTLAVLAGEICGIRNKRSKFATWKSKCFPAEYSLSSTSPPEGTPSCRSRQPRRGRGQCCWTCNSASHLNKNNTSTRIIYVRIWASDIPKTFADRAVK